MHLPAGDRHKPVLAVLREKDALQLFKGNYFSIVTEDQSEASEIRGALIECPAGNIHVAFKTPTRKA